MKLQHMKLENHIAWHENARHEIARHENTGHEFAINDKYCMKIDNITVH